MPIEDWIRKAARATWKKERAPREALESHKPDFGLFRDLNLQMVFGVTLISVLGVASVAPLFPAIARDLGISPARVSWLVERASTRARSRRRLKNSAFWAAVVPVRTIDQLRRM